MPDAPPLPIAPPNPFPPPQPVAPPELTAPSMPVTVPVELPQHEVPAVPPVVDIPPAPPVALASGELVPPPTFAPPVPTSPPAAPLSLSPSWLDEHAAKEAAMTRTSPSAVFRLGHTSNCPFTSPLGRGGGFE